jgi:hypothetical protein
VNGAGVGAEAISLRLILELDLAKEGSVGGSVGAEGGPAESFSGWVGLTRALELAIETRRRAGGAEERGAEA